MSQLNIDLFTKNVNMLQLKTLKLLNTKFWNKLNEKIEIIRIKQEIVKFTDGESFNLKIQKITNNFIE